MLTLQVILTIIAAVLFVCFCLWLYSLESSDHRTETTNLRNELKHKKLIIDLMYHSDIKLGDVVVLKGHTRPKMVVGRFHPDNTIRCDWYDEGEFRFQWIPKSSLKKVNGDAC